MNQLNYKILKNWFLPIFVLSVFAIGCGEKKAAEPLDTPRSGTTTIGCDETLRPILEVEAAIFQSLFPQAKLNIVYASEAQTVLNLMKDSVESIFIGRSLDTSELNFMSRKNLLPQQNVICSDAIAFVVHPSNRDTNITYEKLLGILRGDIKTWSQVGGGAAGNINVVFDQANSGTVATLLRKMKTNAMPPNAFAAKTNTDAIDYVAKNPNALGVVGWSWLSDTDDHLAQSYYKKIKIVGLSRPDSTGGKTPPVFAKPFAENLAFKHYPLDRDVYIVVRSRRQGLASGFSNFVYSEQGQRVLSKAGLWPANDPGREIYIKKTPKIKLEQ